MMKHFIAVILLMASLQAASDLKAMIEEINSATGEERYQKMNAFKKALREMNAQNRLEAIAQLKESLHAGTDQQSSVRTQARAHQGTQTEEGNQQAYQSQQMQRRQIQQQQQIQQQNAVSTNNRQGQASPRYGNH